MAITGAQIGTSGCGTKTNCSDGCGVSDFCIKRHDTKPDFRVSVSDCDGALDLTDASLILEVNMWAKGRLKSAITNSSTSFALADNIGFEQVMVGDIVVFDRARRPEAMLVTSFDEDEYLIGVQRAYNNTEASAWKKGTPLKIFRILNGVGTINSTYDDLTQEDGSTLRDQLVDTSLAYSWTSYDTCLSGCYWLEFKLLKLVLTEQGFTPISFIPDDFDCGASPNIEWVRRFPETAEGFVISIINTPTSESLT